MTKPTVICDPWPRSLDLMFTPEDRAKLESMVTLITSDERHMPASMIDQYLPEASFLMGTTAMPAERLRQAKNLKAILNVEGNFLDNVDYEYCFREGIHVLAISPVFAEVVAEMALGMAISLGRGIHTADRAFHEGCEEWGLASNQGTTLLHRAPVGLIGFGDLARSFLPLVRPFGGEITVFDPWLPDWMIEQAGCKVASLDQVLSTSRYLFVFATVTAENEGFLGAHEFARMPKGANLILVSRAAVVDFDALMDAVSSGHIRAATDVLPEEPTPVDHRVRSIDGFLLSAHRAGAIDDVFKQIGPMLLGDMDLMIRGLPPVGLKRAQRETVSQLRSMAVDES